MNDLDFLIPQEIHNLINEKNAEFSIQLTGVPCQGRYPRLRVFFNDTVEVDEKISGTKTLTFQKNTLELDYFDIRLEYYNKLDCDTTTDSLGNILENQGLSIDKFIVNDIDIVKTNIIYNLGSYQYNLSDAKKQYYIGNNINFENTHSLHMFENGTWSLKFKLPIYGFFTKLKSRQEKHELWPNNELLIDIYNTINNIRKIQNNGTTRKRN